MALGNTLDAQATYEEALKSSSKLLSNQYRAKKSSLLLTLKDIKMYSNRMIQAERALNSLRCPLRSLDKAIQLLHNKFWLNLWKKGT